MSTRKSHKGKYNKRSSTTSNESNNDDGNNGAATATNPAEDLTPIIYKYPGRFSTLNRTILLNENLSINEILTKVSLVMDTNPPEPKKVFEAYFFDEIHPFINKHAQETINSKKEIGKSWEQQHERFKKVYIKRSDMLRNKWIEMKHGAKDYHLAANGNGNDSSSYTVTNHHHHYQKYDKHQHAKSGNASAGGAAAEDPQIGKSQTVIFKYYSVHSSAKTNRHIFITSPTKKELLGKVNIALRETPISAKELFEIYYYDEILPFLKKSGQQSIRGKKELGKVWQIQTKTFKSLYEERARVLLDEWQKNLKKKENKKGKSSSTRHSKETQKMLIHSPKTLSPKHKKKSKSKLLKRKEKKKEKMDCSLIRTLINFLLLVECGNGLKEECFLLIIDDERQKQRHLEYRKLRKFLKENDGLCCCLHLRLFVDKFEAQSLRLHSSTKCIKLCFVHPLRRERELVVFELAFDKLLSGLDERIVFEKMVTNMIDGNVLAIDIPIANKK